MSWNYRIIEHDKDELPYFGLHEVYYDKDDKASAWTERPAIVGDSQAEVVQTLEMMLKDAKTRPVIKESEHEDTSGT